MKKTVVTISLATMLFAFVACSIQINQGVSIVSTSSKGFENAPSKKLDMKSFSTITNNGPLTIEYRQSEEYAIVVLGDTSMTDHLRAEVNDDKLCLSLEPGTYHDLWLKVLVHAPRLYAIHQNGSGNITSDFINHAPEVDIATSGSGDIHVKGIDCQNVRMQISGSGGITTDEVAAEKARLTVNGSGSILLSRVNLEELDASTHGSGNITVDGTATNVEASITGSGSITGKLAHKSIHSSKSGSGIIDLQK